jgi:ABC-2 type transport system ATP-binding protein
MSTNSIIQIRNLSKYYGKAVGIKNLDLDIQKGEIFGFLGQNGAGKTTTIRCVLSILIPDEGSIEIDGVKINRKNLHIKDRIGYLPGELNLPENYRVRDFLAYIESLQNGKATRLQEIVDRFDIPMEKKIRELSKGNKQKVGIALALQMNPDILILDEPTSGLDPLFQKEFYNLMFQEKKKGKTIFFSSHNLDEVQKICDRVGIIRNGIIVSIEDVQDLTKKIPRVLKARFDNLSEDFAKQFEELTRSVDYENGEIELEIKDNIQLGNILQKISNAGLTDLSYPPVSLEEYFMLKYNTSEPIEVS